MSETQENQSGLTRRDALKVLIATSGATALSALPTKWERPLVDVGVLPALAQTSPNQYTFNNEVESIEFEGPGADQLQYAVTAGWIVIAPQGTTVGDQAQSRMGDPLPPWIFSRPWLKVKRKWDVLSPPWTPVIKVKIKIKFSPLPGFVSSGKLKDDNDLWCFGISGLNLGNFIYYVTKLKIKKNKIEIEFLLPAVTGSGSFFEFLYPFFISCYFPLPILLDNGGSLFPGFYVGPGIFGDDVNSSFLK